MSSLQGYVEKKVLLMTQDARIIVGTLKGYDTMGTVVLANSVERIFSLDEGVKEEDLGLYIVRGDNITLVGDFDPQKEEEIDLDSIRAEPIGEIRHF